MRDAPIGVFDSGIGGLTVARALMGRLPAEHLVYFGDTARVPYGPKSPETVRRFARENVDLLTREGVKMVVVACNTATAHALEELRELFPLPVLGVIGPGARAAARVTRTGRVGVIGTVGTIASDAYGRQLRAIRPGIQVVSRACPLLVPLAEEGLLDHAATRLLVREYVEPFGGDGVDALVLGCTHYPLFKPLLGEVLGARVALIDSAEETAREAEEILRERDLARGGSGGGRRRFLVSDLPERFLQVGRVFLGEELREVELARATDD
ncbi:MAG: glutamate racemase [Gemmatimonadota bacterium]